MRWGALSLLLLAGCGGDSGDLHAYVRRVQANPPPYEQALPPMPQFEAVAYQPGERVSPFVDDVRPDLSPHHARPGCLGPLGGPTPPLARVALDSLSMRGILMEGERRWALVQSADGRIHRVRVGDRLGLFGGRVVGISDQAIALVERVEQGMGCYVERQANLSLQVPGGESL
ncbi:pilus assembly protein PilP [Ferrimonas sediminicola]|uniref:Pilus assembly protein PilP n=1 Tax=Ferrimonas sediminicola TaxID=2569538 RepID=A0A4V6WMM7_9GAMM|nr:pilus assembly protein PilP [Ferrimonas sediminicola]TKB48019.1 pilus assembly protein PilP [Ferrimonas sediminicola]